MEPTTACQTHDEREAREAESVSFPWFRYCLIIFVILLFGWGAMTGRLDLPRGQASLVHTHSIKLVQNEVAFTQKLLAYLEELQPPAADLKLISTSANLGGRQRDGKYFAHPWSNSGIKLEKSKTNKSKIQIVYQDLPREICHRFVSALTSQRLSISVNNENKTSLLNLKQSQFCKFERNEIAIDSLET